MDISKWRTPKLELFKELDEYLLDENGKIINPEIWSNIVHVLGDPNTFVFSEALTKTLENTLGRTGKFLKAQYNDQLWYFYYCGLYVNEALDLNLSDYQMYDSNMVLNTPVLLKEKIKRIDCFRLSEYGPKLFISEKIKIEIEHHFVEDVFIPVDVV